MKIKLIKEGLLSVLSNSSCCIIDIQIIIDSAAF